MKNPFSSPLLSKLLAACLLGLLGLTFQAHAVVDGLVVEEQDPAWRFTARLDLSFENGKIERCTGALIHPRIVLTAAHCLVDVAVVIVNFDEPKNNGVSFSKLSKNFTRHPLYTYRKSKAPSQPSNYATSQSGSARADDQGHLLFLDDEHARYKAMYSSRFLSPLSFFENYNDFIEASRRADLGIVVLDEEVPEPFRPLALLKGDPMEHLPYGAELFSYGYGLNKMNIFYRDDQLRYTDLNLVALIKSMIKSGGKTVSKVSNLVVFSMNRPGIIFGDSGGPTILKINGEYLLVGINSAAGIDGHSVLTLPQFYLPWINETAEAYLKTPTAF